MRSRLMPLAMACLSLFGMTALGHHSFSLTYELDQHRNIEGTIAEVVLQNPHSVIGIDVQDGNGGMVRWNVEWASAADLRQAGVTSSTLKVGDKVIVTGAPAKGGDPGQGRLLLQRIVRPADKWSWGGQAGRFLTSTTPLPPLPNP